MAWRKASREFVVRRLNQEFLDHAIDALVAGVYAGDPHKLSRAAGVSQARRSWRRVTARSSKARFSARASARSRGEVAKDRAPKFSFDEGLQVLPDTLAAQLGDAVKLNTPVTKLTQTSGWLAALTTVSKWLKSESQRGDLLRHGVSAGGVGN